MHALKDALPELQSSYYSRAAELAPPCYNPRLYRQDRARSMPYYFFSHIADEQPLDPGASMSGKHDQVDSMTFRSVENFFKGIAGADKIPHFGKMLDGLMAKLFQHDFECSTVAFMTLARLSGSCLYASSNAGSA
jgi:hypothetical protein